MVGVLTELVVDQVGDVEEVSALPLDVVVLFEERFELPLPLALLLTLSLSLCS